MIETKNSDNDETQLWINYREKNDIKSRDILVNKYINIAEKYACSYAKKHESLNEDDVVSWAYESLLGCIDRYKYSGNAKFSTYFIGSINFNLMHKHQEWDGTAKQIEKNRRNGNNDKIIRIENHDIQEHIVDYFSDKKTPEDILIDAEDKKELSLKIEYDRSVNKIFDDTIVMVDPLTIKENKISLEWFSDGENKPGLNKYEHMMASIHKYGIKTPLKLTKDYLIIGGHRRLNIAIKLRLKAIPCQVAIRDLDEDELKLHILEDNYLQRGIGSRIRKKIGDDLLILIRRKYPQWETWARDSKVSLVNKLQEIGLNKTTSRKIASQERRKAKIKDDIENNKTIYSDYQSIIFNLENLKEVFKETNLYTKEKIYPKIESAFENINETLENARNYK